MPEGDSLHSAARRLQPLVGEALRASSPHPRGAALGVAAQLDGRVLEGVEAVGKSLLLRFGGGIVLHSHLRMSGRWLVVPAGAPPRGLPWLVLAGARLEARQLNGPVLEIVRSASVVTRRLGPDVLAPAVTVRELAGRLRAAGAATPIGEALLDQRVIAGVGNMWKAEALWAARVSPWARIGDLTAEQVEEVAAAARQLMADALAQGRRPHAVYARPGRPCPRCGTPIRSRAQGDAARTAYWCPGCQGPPEAGAGPRASYL
jgi:endonuclease-8